LNYVLILNNIIFNDSLNIKMIVAFSVTVITLNT